MSNVARISDLYLDEEARIEWAGFVGVHLVAETEFERAMLGFDLEKAIDWGRFRATVVIVETQSVDFDREVRRLSAGDEEPPGERLPRLRPRLGEAVMNWVVYWGDGGGSVVSAATRGDAERHAVKERIEKTPGSAGKGFTIGSPVVEPLEESA